MAEVIRRASIGDAPALAQLRWDFRTEVEPPKEDQAAFVARCTQWMQRNLQNDSWRCMIVERHAEIVAAGWLHFIEKLPNPTAQEAEQHGYITSLFVRPSARGGTGTALLRALIAEAKSTGVDSLFLWPTQRSRGLYERHGFVGLNSSDNIGSVMELRD